MIYAELKYGYKYNKYITGTKRQSPKIDETDAVFCDRISKG